MTGRRYIQSRCGRAAQRTGPRRPFPGLVQLQGAQVGAGRVAATADEAAVLGQAQFQPPAALRAPARILLALPLLHKDTGGAEFNMMKEGFTADLKGI